MRPLYIQKFADKYGWETVAEIGVGAIFIGVESKFAGDHGYEKRKMADARVVFAKLHEMGVRTIGAWMCGWDFHDHFNIYEDLNYFVACYPTFQQLTRVSPLPGTPFYDEMAQEGRINNVPWEDVHFLSGALQNKSLEAHETLNLIEYGYELLYRTWGPSLLRRFDVMLNGYEFCLNSPNEMLRQYKSLFFKRQCALQWTAVYAMDRFAPNGIVRRRVRKCDERYRRLIGQPTPVMQFVAKTEEILAKSFKQKQTLNPFNRHIIEQPFKRYLYDRDESTAHLDIPYRTQYPHRQSLKEWTAINRFKWQAFIMSQLTNCVRLAYSRRTDPIIDDYIIKAIAQRSFIGF